ncbi:hypothetical protein PFISCL1PPCAC_16780, partial [Pristionchus fissidentatus]
VLSSVRVSGGDCLSVHNRVVLHPVDAGGARRGRRRRRHRLFGQVFPFNVLPLLLNRPQFLLILSHRLSSSSAFIVRVPGPPPARLRNLHRTLQIGPSRRLPRDAVRHGLHRILLGRGGADLNHSFARWGWSSSSTR